MKKIILFMDNTDDYLNVHAKVLEMEGYHVLKARTIEQAEEIFLSQYVHLAILDLRMEIENDADDISGLILAKRAEFRAIPKIICTGYPSVEYVREALSIHLNDLPPAVRFISKGEGPDALVKAVKEVFEQFVRVNLDLSILWDPRDPLSFTYLINLLHPRIENDDQIHHAGELEGLVRQVFFQYQIIRFGRRLWHNRHCFCLPVLAQADSAVTDLRILVCGDREVIRQARIRMEKLAPDDALGIELCDQSETIHFGAVTYSLAGADIDTVQTLRGLFEGGKERPLKSTFAHLLNDVLKPWHIHGQDVQPTNDLMAIYRQWAGLAEDSLPRAVVEKRIDALIQQARRLEAVDISREDGKITFAFALQDKLQLPDPIDAVYTCLAQYTSPIVYRLSPGRLTADNVLVDNGQHVWLTDFAYAEISPQWWDFVCLEAVIRFDLSRAPDLLAWQEFEEYLVKQGQLNEHLDEDEVIQDLRLSIGLIEQVRRQAASETGTDALPYYAGLLVWLVEAMTHNDPGILYSIADRMQVAHLLLAAGLIARRLTAVIEKKDVGGRLRVDEDGRVWLNERCVATLTGNRLKLMQCLYANAGKTVPNQVIENKVYGDSEMVGGATLGKRYQRIRQEISRLRDAIEPDPSRPRYILTDRDKGYRLQLGS